MFPKLSKVTCGSPEELVDYWEQFYEDSKQDSDAEFLAHLKWKSGKLTGDDVRYLFAWKYRPVPSWDPNPIIRHLRELNGLRFREDRSVVEFAEGFSKQGLVKRFFICHVINPRRYPVWDQFVLKAHLLISGRGNEVDQADKLIHDENEYESYRTDFNDWVNQVPSKTRNCIEYPAFRRLDRALFALGKHSLVVLGST